MSARFYLLFLLLTTAALGDDDNPATAPANQAPIALDRFVVTGRLDEAREDIVPSLGATSYQIDRAQIDIQSIGPAAGFKEVLLNVPGVAADSFGQVHLRGEHADLQYRINDVLLPEGLSGFGQEIDPRFVETAAVLTGALPAQYGFRTAGVVDIHTRSGTATAGGDVAVDGGSFDSRRASVEATGSLAGLNAYANASAYTSNLGIENPTAGHDPLHDRTAQFRLFGYFSDVLDADTRLSLLVSGSWSRFQIPNNPGQVPLFTLTGANHPDSAALDENQREENDYAILAYQRTAGAFRAQISLFARYSLVHFTPDRAGDLVFTGVASDTRRALAGGGFEADFKWEASATHTVRAGLLVADASAAARTTTAVFPVDPGGNQVSSTPFDIGDRQRRLGWLSGAYLQDAWAMTPALTVNYGLRADRSQTLVTEGQLSPRVNVVYRLTDATAVHAGYARYFTPPPLEFVPPTDLARFAGTTNAPAVTAHSPVRSERSHYFDVGLSHQVSSALSVTLDGYAKRATDLLDEGQFGQALIFSPFNYRRGRVTGIELAANYTWHRLSAYANLARSRATGRNIVSGEFQFSPDELAYIATHDVPLDHDQTWTASAGGSYQVGGTTFSADLLYGSGLRRGFANTGHLPAYRPLNVGVSHTFPLARGRKLILRLEVVNVLDESYQLRDGSGIGVGAPQFGQRRGFDGGVTLAF